MSGPSAKERPTKFGAGKIEYYRETDEMYCIKLPSGTVHGPRSCFVSDGDDTNPASRLSKSASCKNMSLEAAYQSLDQMRRFNLQVACQNKGILCTSKDLEHSCRTCLLASKPQHCQKVSSDGKSRFPVAIRRRLTHFLQNRQREQWRGQACLTCGHHVCSRHASKPFRQQNLTICQECERIFTVDFVVDCLTASNPADRQTHVDRMVDLYDRVTLLLRHAAENTVEDVGACLEKTQTAYNQMTVGSSSVGMVSGVLGVAAATATTMALPAVGAPLLIASLVCGGGASAVQTTTRVRTQFYSHPHLEANRVLALHGMARAILGVTSTLRDALTRDFIRTDMYLDSLVIQDQYSTSRSAYEDPIDYDGDDELNEDSNERSALSPSSTASSYDTSQRLCSQTVLRLNASRVGIAGVEWSSTALLSTGAADRLVGGSFPLVTRSTTNLVLRTTAQLASVAGGALSAATLILEARSLNRTLQNLRQGSPCEKARALRCAVTDAKQLPSTGELQGECGGYLDTMRVRERRWTEQEAVQLLLETFNQNNEKKLKPDSREDQSTVMTSDDEDEMSSVGGHSTRSGRRAHPAEDPCDFDPTLSRRWSSAVLDADEALTDYEGSENDDGDYCDYDDGGGDDDDAQSVQSSTTTSTRSSLIERITRHKRKQQKKQQQPTTMANENADLIL